MLQKRKKSSRTKRMVWIALAASVMVIGNSNLALADCFVNNDGMVVKCYNRVGIDRVCRSFTGETYALKEGFTRISDQECRRIQRNAIDTDPELRIWWVDPGDPRNRLNERTDPNLQ